MLSTQEMVISFHYFKCREDGNRKLEALVRFVLKGKLLT